jgi:hypothetical protein
MGDTSVAHPAEKNSCSPGIRFGGDNDCRSAIDGERVFRFNSGGNMH